MLPPVKSLTLSCARESSVRYVVRFALIAVYTVFWGVPAILVAPFSGEAIVWIGRTWISWIFRTCGVRVVAEGLEHVDRTQSYLFMSNHQSVLDIGALVLTLPVSWRFVAKRELTWILLRMGPRTLAPDRAEPVPVPADLAVVCVVRPQRFGWAASFLHYDNGRLVAVTEGGAVYACYQAEPGWHHLTARSDNDAELDLHVGPGERHFVRLVVTLGPDSLELLPEEEARQMLSRLRYAAAVSTMPDVPSVCNRPVPALGAPRAATRGCPIVLTAALRSKVW